MVRAGYLPRAFGGPRHPDSIGGPSGPAAWLQPGQLLRLTRQGSLPELDSAPLVGSAEYRLAASLENGARQFKAALPPGVKLFVGLTPVPEQLAGRDFASTHAEILRLWGAWLGADALLTNLPATLPNDQFARSTHLKPQAVPDYTTALANSLAGQTD